MEPISALARRLALGGTLLALAVGAMPTAASALDRPDEGSVLSPTVTELAEPAVRSLPAAEQAAVLGVAAEGPGSLVREGNRVMLNVRFEHGALAGLEDLEAIGAQPISVDAALQTATVAAAPGILKRFEGVPGVASVTTSRAPLLFGSGSAAAAGGSVCEGGSVISEGLTQLHVDQARSAFGLRGAGITVGVLSDSFDRATEAADASGPVATDATEDVVAGDLPGAAGPCSGQRTEVAVLEDAGAGTDEGRAMLQIVHDLAPEASLAFATAFSGEESFAQNIERLAAPVAVGGGGAQVIVDDVAYFEEPFFQDGPVAAAVDKVSGEGVTYLSAAGNDNIIEGEDEIASWEAPAYRESGGCPTAVQELSGFNGTHCMDFDPGPGTDRTFGIAVAPGATLTADLQWAEPWNGVTTDLDAFLLNSKGEVPTGSAEENVGKTGTQRPVEIVQWENKTSSTQTVRLVINRYSGAANPRLKLALLGSGSGVTSTEYPSSAGGDVVGPTIFGHAGAVGAIAVAAVPYFDSSEPETYSSRGPVTHYFGPVAGTAPASPLPSPETIAKPDLAATDCGATTFFAHRYDGVTWRFCGTSAAAPHAAAVAALMREAAPEASTGQIRAALSETASPVGNFPADAVGSGLVDAYAALASLTEPVARQDVPSVPAPAPQPEVPAPLPAPVPVPAPPTTAPIAAAPPDTFFKRHPPEVVRTRNRTAKLTFRLGSDEPMASFLCKVDNHPFQRCAERFSHRFVRGRHTVRARARNAAGAPDPTPAIFRFRVMPIRVRPGLYRTADEPRW